LRSFSLVKKPKKIGKKRNAGSRVAALRTRIETKIKTKVKTPTLPKTGEEWGTQKAWKRGA
jgi:hypothetical protein